jgi:muramoyltetrapeptide carboxypeptidase
MLSPGSQIALISPSGVHDPSRLEISIELVQSWGYRILRGPHLGARHRYLAGTVEQRQKDLQWALTAPGIDGVWFSRGGFGTAHLLPDLRWGRVPAGRPVIGFSDATALFSAMLRKGRGRPVHGPVLHSLASLPDAASLDSLRALLEGRPRAPMAIQHLAGPRGERRGRLVGGNLAVLASLCGTPWAMRAEGAVVVLEDTNEAPYRVDRLLTQLLQSRALRGAEAILFGELDGSEPPAGATWTLWELIAERLGGLGIPVYRGLPIGHLSQNHALELGREARLCGDELHVG